MSRGRLFNQLKRLYDSEHCLGVVPGAGVWRCVVAELGFGLFDCDTHCYESRDAFTRYLPKRWLGQAIAPVRMPDGTERIMAADRVAVFNSEQGLGFDYAYKPG